MPLLRPTTALNAARTITRVSAPSAVRPFSSTSAARGGADHAHEDHYDPPTGWLWGIKPGEKYQKEGWEGLMVWGFFGSLGLGVVAYAFKPDTSYVCPSTCVELDERGLALRLPSACLRIWSFMKKDRMLTNGIGYKPGLSRRHEDD
jgi:hypothetical protein